MKGLEAKTMGLKKMIRHEYKRIVAFMLTVAMVVTNFGTNLTVAFAAGEETSSLFLLDSSELKDAISTALESGEVFDFSSLELKAKQKSLKTSYEKLIGSKAGEVYQLDVDVDSSYASENTDLQVFYNAGTDSVVFLFINESDMAVTFRANVSGYETARVTVNPNTSNIEDAEGVENAEDYSNTTMVDDEKKAKAEVVKPEGETSESDENGSDETEEETKADVTESETASENGETEETTGAENSSETEETTAAEETEAEVEETAEETEAAEPETEAPAAEEELQAEEGSATASISAKEVFRVSTSAEVAEETLADSTEEETEAETEDKAEVPEKETEAIPETTEAEETVAEDKTEETVADESKADETTAADETADGETVADETKDGELVNDETEAPAENPADNNGDSSEVGFDGDEQFLEDDSIELMGELAGKAYNTVTIWGRANARAYAVKAEDLVGEAAVEGQYNVDYSVDPVGAAAIKGAHTVNEGETLYFAVDPQVGYEITEVTANGEELEEVDAAGVASASNLEKYAHVYAVEEVSEDLEIVASLEETENVAHPEFNASYVGSDGVTISLHAEEGILPEGTELDVTEVTEALGDTIKEKMESESEGAAVNKVLAYDINLLYNGEKLSNSWSEDGYVDVTFTGAPIQEMTETSDKVEIVAVDDTSKTQLTAEKAEAVETSELKLESVSEQSVEGEAVEEVGFKAEHFTIYAVAMMSMDRASTDTVRVEAGKMLTITGTRAYEHKWRSEDISVATVLGDTSSATLRGIKRGTVLIRHEYRNYLSWEWNTEYFNVEVTASQPSITVTPTTAKLTQKGQTTTLSAVLSNMDSHSIVSWSTSDAKVATVENGVVTAVGNGTATITASVRPEDDEYHANTYSATATITVEFKNNNLYYYALIPGQKDDGSVAADSAWFGIGIDEISGLADPSSYRGNYGTKEGLQYNVEKNVKALYPKITFNGKNYTYAETGSENSYKEGYYTLEAYRLVVSNGANAGNNGYNTPTVAANNKNQYTRNTYHLDHVIKLNEEDYKTVTFNVLYPGETEFASLTDYAQRVKKGYAENRLDKPTEAALPSTMKDKDGIDYRLEKWYTSSACTTKAGFNGTIIKNTAYYAKYVPVNQKYSVEYYYDGVKDSALTKVLGPETIGTRINTYPPENKTGYTLTTDTIQQNGSLSISADASRNVIKVYYSKRNVTLYYKVAGNVGGTVSPEFQYLPALAETANGSTASPASGYKLTGWYSDEACQNKVGSENFFKPQKTGTLWTNGQTWYAKFDKRSDIEYTVEFYTDSVINTNHVAEADVTYHNGVFDAALSDLNFSKEIQSAYLPDGYQALGEVDTSKSLTRIGVDSSKNIIRVVLKKRDNLRYKVRFYRDNTDEENYVADSEKHYGPVEFGTALGELVYSNVSTAVPTGYSAEGVLDSENSLERIQTDETLNVIRLVLHKRNDLSYTVKFYKDMVDASTYINKADVVGNNVTFGTPRQELGFSTSIAAKYLPGGYKQQGVVDASSIDSIGAESDKNIINVVLSKRDDLSYTVKFYKDSYSDSNYISGADQNSENKFTYGTRRSDLPISTVIDSAKCPQGYNAEGTIDSDHSFEKLGVDGTTVVVILTKKSDLSYVVKFYKDAVADENLCFTSAPYTKVTYGTLLADLKYEDTLKESDVPSGYQAKGVLDVDHSLASITEEPENNVISLVLHKRNDLEYTVQFYKDNVNPDNHIADADVVGKNATYKTPVSELGISTTIANGKAPEGYQATGTIDPSSITEITEDSTANIIKVVLPRLTNLTYRVKFYKDSVADGNYIDGADKLYSDGVTFETPIADLSYATEIELESLRPEGYVVTGTVDFSKSIEKIGANSEQNIIRVYLTKRADLKYTVKYYKDSVSDGNHIALADREYPNAVYNTPLSALTVEKTLASDLVPLGYQATGTIDTAHSLDKIGINDNIICVVLPRRKDIPYTINYYKDDMKASNLLESIPGTGTLGDTIRFTNGDYCPSGYKKEGTVSGTTVITEIEKDNVVNIVYERMDFLYSVTYHYEDAKGKKIDTDDSVKNVFAKFESVIPYDYTSPKTHKIDGVDHNFVLDKVVLGNTLGEDGGAIVTIDSGQNTVDVYYALDEIGEQDPEKPDGIPDKYQVVFTYVAEDHGVVTGTVKEVVTRYEGDKKFSTTAPAYPNAAVTATPDSGYNFVNWTSDNPAEASKNIVAVLSRVLQRYSATNAEFADVDEIRNAGFTKDTEFTAHFIASDATTYKVEVYYEHEGKYSSVPSKSIPMTGVTDTQATVKAEDYLPTSGYVFDQNAANVLSGTIAGDNSLVLKVYYKQVFKVTYAPGDHGSFKSQTYAVSYGNQTPGFSGDKTANGNYRFTGWDKTIESKVTGDIVYTAQWAANSNGGGIGGGGGGSSSGGGGGSSSGPRDNGSTPSGGPGATTVTIDPDAVPLANLPNEDGAADLLVIDDEDVPLAALPKTGQSGASGLVLFLSSMMLAAFVAVSKKREDDK